LWGLLVLIPACGAFFCVDARVLNEWRREILTLWIARDIDFTAFAGSLRANPVLPKETISGMLLTLPCADNLVTEQKLLSPTREAIATVSLGMHRSRADALLLQTIASAIVVSALLAARWTAAWNPLCALAAIALVPPVRLWAVRRRRLRSEAEVAVCREQAGFNEADFARVVETLK
jgi:hypothetical protein